MSQYQLLRGCRRHRHPKLGLFSSRTVTINTNFPGYGNYYRRRLRAARQCASSQDMSRASHNSTSYLGTLSAAEPFAPAWVRYRRITPGIILTYGLSHANFERARQLVHEAQCGVLSYLGIISVGFPRRLLLTSRFYISTQIYTNIYIDVDTWKYTIRTYIDRMWYDVACYRIALFNLFLFSTLKILPPQCLSLDISSSSSI